MKIGTPYFQRGFLKTFTGFSSIYRKMCNASVDFSQIRNHLSQFKGGEITLSRNLETGVAIVTLNHPEKRNALSGNMMVHFRDIMEQLEKWQEGKAVVIHGKGGNLCSGADLDFARSTGTPKEGLMMNVWMQDTLRRLQQLPLFSVCLAEGPTLGGGAEVSAFCDYIVVADNVKYGFVHGKMGIITAFGGSTRLAKKIGHTKALDMVLTARIMSAKECIDVGLAECIVPSTAALEKTLEWLNPRLQHHYLVTRGFKEVISKAETENYENAFDFEKNKFAPLWGAPVNKEALARGIKHVNTKHSKM